MPHKSVLSTVVLALCFAGGALAAGENTSKVNGSIRLETGQQAGDLSTVNGSIRMADKASAAKVSTVNGAIELGVQGGADSIGTVNGSITLGAGAKVAKGIKAVNGSIRLGERADVAGPVSNVNGRIALEAAHVGGGITTVSGDIDIGADSRVEGGLVVEKQRGWSWSVSRNPRIVIGPRAVVTGNLEFRRDVDLYVSSTAKIGPVSGATAKSFSGDQP